MTLLNYSKYQFMLDCRGLNLTACNPIAHRIADEFNISFFGGQHWQNFEIDSRFVTSNNLSKFCFCLFVMTCCDQHMFTSHREFYQGFRRKFKYPKFGWCGFGPHFEKPKWILDTAEIKGVNFDSIDTEQLVEFLDSQVEIITSLYSSEFAKIFFGTLLNDVDFTANTDFFTRFKGVITNIKY